MSVPSTPSDGSAMAARRATDGPPPRRVLLVDDSRAIRAILRRMLEAGGYEVVEAGDGRQGIDAAREQHPDLVLLDIDMPVMDGLAAMREMQDDPDLAGLPVMFLTARTGGDDVAAGLGLGAQDYLRKPCEAAELLARVASALRMKSQENALRAQARALDTLSATDPLTGLGNRRHLQSRVDDVVARSGADLTVGVLLADLDHFKAVNDTLGHPVGDIVLRIAAARLRGATAPDATLVRWGGEEFLAVVPGLDATGVLAAGEAWRAAVCAGPFAYGVDRTVDVTVSVGVASGRIGDLDTLTAAADRALYAAKAAGRDQVST